MSSIQARKGPIKAKKAKQQEDEQIEVIQDLYFPAACNRVKMSNDGEILMASGMYPPQAIESRRKLLLSQNHCRVGVAASLWQHSLDMSKYMYSYPMRHCEWSVVAA